jgi:hypothetical protein
MNKKILLVGTVSNVAKTIEKELKVVLKALSVFDSVQVFLVESDSTDETIKVLEKMKLNNNDFNYITLGKLKDKYPHRIERISHCRNVYVEYVRKNNGAHKLDYVAVADLDGMNFKLNKKGVESCFRTELDWAGIMANQKYGYYDIYPLRAKGWIEEDCFTELSKAKQIKILIKPKWLIPNFITQFCYFDGLRYEFIFRHMKKIDPSAEFIEIDSGFGGFAIYRATVFKHSDYTIYESELNQSEHVNFHLKLRRLGMIFYINPRLINANFNVYNLNRFKFVRFSKELKKLLFPS